MEKATVKSGIKEGLSRDGFTMVEVMVSVFLMALVMTGAYALITRASALSRVARNHYVAVSLCKNRLERARTLDYASVPLLAENNVIVNDSGMPESGAMFSRTTTVNTNTVSTNCLEMVVTVKIRNQRSGQFVGEKEQMSSLYTDYELAP
jgi:prepilin-type N-terminal cleavage/methylation domain-containing protein